MLRGLRRLRRSEPLVDGKSRQQAVDAIGRWFHSIDVGEDVITPGETTPAGHAAMLDALRLPDLKGKTVLDIGTYDGFYAFEAERRGAARVVALDHYMWSFDVADVYAYYERCRAEGVVPTPYHEVKELWRPDELPGKRGFDTAHRLLESRVEPVVADFMDLNLADLGEFDVVLYLGVLYHMEDPVRALRRVGEVTRELAVIETEAVHLPGHENQPLFEFYPSNELNADVSNWWAPNLPALLGLCRPGGFTSAEAVVGPPSDLQGEGPRHYRAVVHARK